LAMREAADSFLPFHSKWKLLKYFVTVILLHAIPRYCTIQIIFNNNKNDELEQPPSSQLSTQTRFIPSCDPF